MKSEMNRSTGLLKSKFTMGGLYSIFTMVLLLAALLGGREARAQRYGSEVPYFSFGKGVGIISPDSMYLLNIRFRMQNRVGLTTESMSDLSLSEVEARIRRLRLRFDGFMLTERLTYVIQLSFTRGDLDFDDTGFPNIIRDAMLYYAVTPRLTIGLGQTKLPGNRQRVNSSGDLQFTDRSVVNSNFNIDRDFGLQVIYRQNIEDFWMVYRASLTSGEGRNINTTDLGLAYTGRVEFLPLGLFKNGGDYFEGDLMREEKPKISLGLTFSRNEEANRAGGTIGPFLFENRDINTYMSDFLMKYNGFALSTELLLREANDPITVNSETGDEAHVLTGLGWNLQASYLFKNNFEVAARYSTIRPEHELAIYETDQAQYQVGVTKYLRGHRLKLQSDLTYDQYQSILTNDERGHWILRFQVELGI